MTISTRAQRLTAKTAPHFPQLRNSIYAQDPAFSAVDVAFLATVGVKVLPVPEASRIVRKGTVLYAPHCVRGIYLDALGVGSGGRGGSGGHGERGDGANGGEEGGEGPALVVGNDVEALIDGYVQFSPPLLP